MISEPQEIEKKLIQTTSASHQRNVARVKRDEEELEALLKQARGETDETEEAVEAKPSSEDPVEPKVQTESSTEQEEEPEGEAQEDDAATPVLSVNIHTCIVHRKMCMYVYIMCTRGTVRLFIVSPEAPEAS